MQELSSLCSAKPLNTFADYLQLNKQIAPLLESQEFSSDKKIKIALLHSFTANGIEEVLRVKCCQAGLAPQFYLAPYNQYAQEILNEKSGLYQFNPDLIILFVDTRALMGDLYFTPYQISDEERKDWVGSKLEEIKGYIEKIRSNSQSKILIHNFEVPGFSPLGILENRQSFGFIESIEETNAGLRGLFKEDSQVFVFDYNGFCSRIGKQNIMDEKMYYLGDIKFEMKRMPDLCGEYLGFIRPLKAVIKKVIVLDLDNTLWGGVIGEEGVEGIALGPTPEGRPFWEFQKYLLSLFQKGIVLAVNSKNNAEDALKFIREHPYQILKEEHFASLQVNWNDKISNMKQIAADINVGLDSIVFMDDDKFNRSMIKEALPEILTVDLPEDPSLYLKTLSNLNVFNTLQLTEEDKKKGRMYAEQRSRQEFQKSTTDITAYLKELKTEIVIAKPGPLNIGRISQLTQKTNQFNMTTRRYLEEDIKNFSQKEQFLLIPVHARDKFGDNGLTGLMIVKKDKEEWNIDTFLMSCRILGRKIEEAMLAHVLKLAKKEKALRLTGELIYTKKNIPARNFYRENGFQLVSQNDEKEVWSCDVNREYTAPEFIKLTEEKR